MQRPKGMDPVYYKFIYVPVVAILGIYIVSVMIQTFIPNDIFRYILVTGGVLGVIALYYKKEIMRLIGK